MPIASGAGGKPKQYGIKPVPTKHPTTGHSLTANRTTNLRRENAASRSTANLSSSAKPAQTTQQQDASPMRRKHQQQRGQSADRMINAPPRVEERRHLKVHSLYGSRPPWATDFDYDYDEDNENDNNDNVAESNDRHDGGSDAERAASRQRSRSETRRSEDDTQIAEQTNQTAGATVMVVDEQQQAVGDNDDSDRDTVGDEHCCSDFGNDADDDVSERLPQADDNIAPALYTASSIDSLDLLAAVNRPQLRQQEDPSSLSSTVDHYLAARLAGDESSEDFSDLVPNSSDKFGFSDSESLSSSLLDSAVGGASGEGSSTSICGVCSKKVYPMEMVTTNGVAYHKFCCKCSKCNRVLSVGNFGVLSGALYCQVHYTDAVRLQDGGPDPRPLEAPNEPSR
uniref:LIM zinc-binding domain-containing protein n=1 Tax=Macrostomum lignano TaxID=282301 RepID=A0A1I8HD99_9PLAT